MAALYNQVIITYIDKNGEEVSTFWTTQDQDPGDAATYIDLATAAQACSDAGVYAITFQRVLIVDNPPGDGDYCTVFDRVNIAAQIPSTNQPVTLGLIAPKSEILQDNLVDLDLENADVMALSAEMEAWLGDRNSAPQGPILRGMRLNKRT